MSTTDTPPALESLRKRLSDYLSLRHAGAVLDWDMQTHMPAGGAPARAEQLGVLSRIAHEMFTGDETGTLLERSAVALNGADPDSDDARLLRNARREYDLEVKIPSALAEEISRHGTLSQDAWQKARAENDFAAFAPFLEKTFDLVRQTAEAYGYESEMYDAVLDRFEPDAKTAEVVAMFDELKPRLIELTRAIVASGQAADDDLPNGPFPVEAQSSLTSALVSAIGYDFERGRQDQAAHPFCTSFSSDDVRITTRYNVSRLEQSLYASLHEAGHALYEQGIPGDYNGTFFSGGVSSAVHESQSRLWENIVGRSRAFTAFAYPKVQATFPGVFAAISEEKYYRGINRVTPSFIRVEADEVTYNLHVLLRFELERDLLLGKLAVRDLPDAWNAKMDAYLGITPDTDTVGCLQDVHWSAGLVGYFPTYSMGNLLSGQLYACAKRDLPTLEEDFAAGTFAPLLEWLREKVHRYGAKFTPREVILKATGAPLGSSDYLAYLTAKYADLYGV